MIKKTLVIALACAGIAFGGAAHADRDGRDYHRGGYDHNWHGSDKHHGPSKHYRQGYRDAYRDRPVVYRAPRAWVRGDRLPNYRHGGYYVVNDWQARRLHRPQPGHQWVRVGSEYMLVAIATGIITGIILSK